MNNTELRQIFNANKDSSIWGESFWRRKYEIEIKPFFKMAKSASNESRLRLLHFKILHNIYPTNILLHKMKIKASNHCKHCGKTDYVEHFFFHCGKLAGFWKLVAHSVQRITGIDMNIDEKMAFHKEI